MTRGQKANDDGAWSDEFCAEHDGSVRSFAALNESLDELSDYRALTRTESWNMVKGMKLAAMSVAVATGAGTLAVAAGPALASALGGTGLLGAASTGTAISTLSGAALQSASLAALGGGGGMAAGTAVLTATGSALGGTIGGHLTNCYIGEIDGFEVRRLAGNGKKKKAALLFVNGFLQQDAPFADWRAGTAHLGRRNYALIWESRRLRSIGTALLKAGATKVATGAVARAATRGVAAALGPIPAALMTTHALANPWHVAMSKAQLTGVALADLMSRVAFRHTLMGHSLGARVIFYALQALATRKSDETTNRHGKKRKVKDVVLLGGAVGHDPEEWKQACSAVKGTVYNCYSKNDGVLAYASQPASGFLSTPIGLGPIEADIPNLVNIDCSDIIDSHFSWKKNLKEVLQRARECAS